jgi:hypothetical protein
LKRFFEQCTIINNKKIVQQDFFVRNFYIGTEELRYLLKEVLTAKGGEPMRAKLVTTAKGIVPLSLHCIGTGHFPTEIGDCLSGYVPWAGRCEFGKQT